MSVIINGDTGIDKITDGSIETSDFASSVPLGTKNLIINGDMRIDQRNAGSSVTPTSEVTLDRWYARENTDGAYTVQQVTDAPVGATNSLKLTVTTADASIAASQFSYIHQRIEGNNIAHLDWGTSDAKTVTLSFWVKSSLTGLFPVTLQNNANNRSYITTYTISSANTWEYKTVTIEGDTTGTWLTDNGIGIKVIFGIGTGSDRQGTADTWNAADAWETSSTVKILNTLNATWQISLVQLEVGSTATDFENLPYDVKLQRCQRYYETNDTGQNSIWSGYCTNGNTYYLGIPFKVTKRATPSCTFTSAGVSSFPTSGGINNVNTFGLIQYRTANGTNTQGLFQSAITADAEL